jgi:RimJ/RimL family protein N-acetyltransferase
MMETGRLRLRPTRLADAETLFTFLGDPQAMRFTHVQPSLRACRRHIAAYEHQRARIGCAPWTILEKAGGSIVGWGGLYEDPFDRGWGIEIGYFFVPSAWGRGYATELAMFCVDLARAPPEAGPRRGLGRLFRLFFRSGRASVGGRLESRFFDLAGRDGAAACLTGTWRGYIRPLRAALALYGQAPIFRVAIRMARNLTGEIDKCLRVRCPACTRQVADTLCPRRRWPTRARHGSLTGWAMSRPSMCLCLAGASISSAPC